MVFIVIKNDWESNTVIGVFSNRKDALVEKDDDVNKVIEVWDIDGMWANNL